MKTISGLFYRIVYEKFADQILDGVISPEGRFHHSGQPALYLSPSIDAAGHGLINFVRNDDPPRVSVPLQLNNGRLLDIRDHATCDALDVAPEAPITPWQPQREAGEPATTWQASDAVRRSGADGMIYTARTNPARWHVVLFHWNNEHGAALSVSGKLQRWPPNIA
ncbi:hypothetical protein DL239_12345 [Sedimentitalea sp. CY04]|uniref:RES domain-containing protein n=1 Tax=Parasedimentitalea denitrificans TaxID=2211118 RepID=A0ABX0W8K5_9RHOB|nr:RES family NAD+ phosphorylase [Sedimentitalea sp. CY04]NIZ61761.1 hypothetical protein [Sedimentitalea sp. CY04]